MPRRSPRPPVSKVHGQHAARELMLGVFKHIHDRMVTPDSDLPPLPGLLDFTSALTAGDLVVVRIADARRRTEFLNSMLRREVVKRHEYLERARDPEPGVSDDDDGDNDDDTGESSPGDRVLLVCEPDRAGETLADLLASCSGVPRGPEHPTERDFQDLIMWADTIVAADLTFDDASPLIGELEARVSLWTDVARGLVVIYDPSHLRAHTDRPLERESDVVKLLRRWARDLRVPIVVFGKASEDGAALSYSLYQG